MNLSTSSIFKLMFSLLMCLNVFSQKTHLSLRQRFTPNEFIFKLSNNTNNLNFINSATLDEMPSLYGEKLSYYLVNLGPCSMNTFHLHPRASELLFVIEGKNLQVGFLEENGGRMILNEIEAGHTMLYPKGLIHFENNLGCLPVRYLSAMNNEDPGLITVVERVFDFPALAVQASFNISERQYLRLKNNIPQNQLVNDIDGCKKRCKSNNTGSLFKDFKRFNHFIFIIISGLIQLDFKIF